MPEQKQSREDLAFEQKQLLEALLAGANPPEGFNQSDIQTARDVLLRKRIRTMQRAMPQLQSIFDNVNNRAILNKYIKANPSSHPEGPWKDGKAFLFYMRFGRWLKRDKL